MNQRGRAEVYEATDAERDLACRAAAATGTRIAGIDIIRDADGLPFVLEVNAVPGWKALGSVTKVDVASLLIRSIEEERKQR